MDEFIKIVCSSQLDNETGNAFVEYFSPLTEKLKGLLSENLYSEFEELLFSCCAKKIPRNCGCICGICGSGC